MESRRVTLLLLLPLGLSLAACESSQPSYSAADTHSAPPPAQTTPPPPPPEQPKAESPPPVAVTPAPTPPVVNTPPRVPSARAANYANRYAAVLPGKMGPVPKLGVGGCDDYIERYRTCFNEAKIPHEERFPMRRALNTQVREWKAAIAAGQISTVASACAAADQKARAQFVKVGCTSF